MYLSKRVGGQDYNCRATSRGIRCPAAAGIRADWLDKYVTDQFLTRIGDAKMTKVITRKGYHPPPDLRELAGELRALYADRDTRRSKNCQMDVVRSGQSMKRLTVMQTLIFILTFTAVVGSIAAFL